MAETVIVAAIASLTVQQLCGYQLVSMTRSLDSKQKNIARIDDAHLISVCIMARVEHLLALDSLLCGE